MTRNELYAHCLIGFDVKPLRNKRIRRNRYRSNNTKWVISAVVALISLAIIVGIR